MKIDILEYAEGAQVAEGLTVIIDVFRAFTVACYAFDSGVASIIATAGIDEAFRLKKNYRKSVLAGERDEKKIPGFDLGNSPTEVLMADLKGVTLIHTTTAGTNGLIKATNASEVITGSLVNAAAVARYIKQAKPEIVSLVAMGYRGHQSAEEDILCARIIASRLENNDDDFSERIQSLRNSSGKRFFRNENMNFSPPSDFFLCTMADRFNFILKATKRSDNNIDLMKIEI